MLAKAKLQGVGVDSRKYHADNAKRGEKNFQMSPSALKEFVRCPARWVKGYSSPDSSAKDFGKLLDCMLLTPGDFDSHYAIQPAEYRSKTGELKPWNNNADACRAWHAEQAGKEVISSQEFKNAGAALDSILADETLAAFVQACLTQVMVTGVWQDKDTGIEVPVRCLIDMVPRVASEFAKCLGDVKTTRNAGLEPFSRFAYAMDYHVQAAFDTDLYVAATGEDRNTWCMVLVENYAPWQSAKRMLSQDFMDLGRSDYRRALALYCRCLKAGFWPGYDDTDEAVQGWSIVAPDPWMANKAAFAPKTMVTADGSHETNDEQVDLIP